MVCPKKVARLCCQLTRYSCLLFVCAAATVLTSQLTQRVLLTRDANSSQERLGVRLSFSLTSVFQNEGNVVGDVNKHDEVNKTEKASTAKNFESFKSHTKRLESKTESVTPKIKKEHKMDTEKHFNLKSDDLVTRYNVTPDAKWLKSFYNIDASVRRKSLFDFPFIIDGRNICSKTRDPFLLIFVLSVHTHIDTREAIRNTWGRAANPGAWPKVGILPDKVKLIFLFGNGKTALKNTIVRDESKAYNDIVQADFVDSYFNLTYKVVTGIRWVAKFCPGAKYILKADEDVFVHVNNLINMLKEVPEAQNAMFYGHTHVHAAVLRTGRWAVTPTSFPFPFYPSYTCGNTYIIPGSKAMAIYKMARYLDYMNIEDVFVTGILRTLIGAGVQGVVGFTSWYEKKPLPCEFKNTIRISATRVTDPLQYDIWEGLKSNVKNCYKITKKRVNLKRPEHVIKYKNVIRDEHIYFNGTDKQFYSIG